MPESTPDDQTRDGPEGPDKGLSRRRMLQAMGAAGAAVAVGGLVEAPHAAAAGARSASASVKTKRTGTIKDLKHIVVLMQENRSFDHLFGTLGLRGSAGFADKQAVAFNNGQSIFFQPDTARPEGFLLPYHLDTTKFNAQNVAPTMGYYESTDVPWHYALASAYTVGDHYHCSLLAATEPNRSMLMTGTIDPDGDNGGPLNHNGWPPYHFTYETYPEVLQKAGVSWQVYFNQFGWSDATADFFSANDDYTLQYFAAFNTANENAENTVPRQGLLARANIVGMNVVNGVFQGPPPPAGVKNDTSNLDFVLQDFINDCAAGLLPEISWIAAPADYCEHPGDGSVNSGAAFVDRVVQALHDNPDLWDSTLLIINYDEANGTGFFDHILHPVPEAGTKGEGAPGLSPGMGLRVPLILVSPWTRGGWVAKETFDHTSTIQLMETWTTAMGKPAISTNISDWRRSICGDLTSAIDFTSFDNSFPTLPTVAELIAAHDREAALPTTPPEPAAGTQTFPVQQVAGPLQIRPAPYQQHATVAVDRSTGQVTATMSNTSAKAVSMITIQGSVLATPFSYLLNTQTEAVPNTVSKQTGPKTFVTDTSATGGAYDFAIYGPDHFIRSFTGTVIPDGQNTGKVPSVNAKLGTGNTKTLKITLSNAGRTPVTYALTRGDYEGSNQTAAVRPGQHVMIDWPTNQYGYYDVTVTADTTATFAYRYAGKIS